MNNQPVAKQRPENKSREHELICSTLQGQLDNLSNQLDRLAYKVEPISILRTEDMNIEGKSLLAEPRSPFIHELYNISERLEKLQYKLNDIIDQIQV